MATQFFEDGTYKGLSLEQQMYAFFPYHHAENLDLQKKAKPIFERLAKEDAKFDWIAKSSVSYNSIIDRFGRFPHRNHVLDRESTKEEWDYLVKDYLDPPDLEEFKEAGILPREYWEAIQE